MVSTGDMLRRLTVPRAGATRARARSCHHVRAMVSTGEREGWGRWPVRGLALLGAVLITLSAVGWWLSTRVLDSEGFADVVTQASQRAQVRDYIADQATLRLAKTSNFVSAARPIVADAISQAIATPPVAEAIHDFTARAHDQIFRITQTKR